MIVVWWMVWTVDGQAPGFLIATITATAGLLGDEEADVVTDVICSMEASWAEHAAVVQRAIPVTGELIAEQAE